jgi:Txe/YoeB family toxin of Txe-Axe toxin-antitoxin module
MPDRVETVPEPWLIHFFQREQDDTVPAIDFLEALPPKIAAEIHAVLDAVASAPPPAFSGGGKWEAMHGDMAGYYEVRVQGGGMNHRLFCVLDRAGEDLGGSSIICIDGLSKPKRSAAAPRDYRRAKRFADEFRVRRSILR